MSKNCVVIAGVDQGGRGTRTGPIVAAAVIFSKPLKLKLKDSKKLNFKQRCSLAKKIKAQAIWSIGVVSSFEIDKYGLQPANIKVAQRAINNLPIKSTHIKLDMISGFTTKHSYELIIKGDDKVLEIMAASIVAKDYRDNMMIQLSKHYKEYGFEKHKGYGTKLHQNQLKKHGVSVLHRTTFAPIKKYLTN